MQFSKQFNWAHLETPMTVAATLARPRVILMNLFSDGAYLDFRNRRGFTPIHVAAQTGNRDAIRVSFTCVANLKHSICIFVACCLYQLLV